MDYKIAVDLNQQKLMGYVAECISVTKNRATINLKMTDKCFVKKGKLLPIYVVESKDANFKKKFTKLLIDKKIIFRWK